MKQTQCKHCGFWTDTDKNRCNYCGGEIELAGKVPGRKKTNPDSSSRGFQDENWLVNALKWLIGRR